MKKTLAVILTALLSVARFATIGSAATSASLNADYTGVSLLKNSDNLSVLFDGNKYEDAVAKLDQNETVSLETLEKICCALDCDIENVVELIKNDGVNENDNA